MYRYRKINDGFTEVLLMDPLSEPIDGLVACNRALAEIPVCQPKPR